MQQCPLKRGIKGNYLKYYRKTVNSGFTLIEIMLALFIFATVALVVTSVLHNILSSRKQLALHSTRFNQLQVATALLQQDLSQIINRPIKDNTGATEPALIGLFQRIDFTRGGLANPMSSEKRSNLQRISYFVRDNNLIRASFENLDQTAQDNSNEKTILAHVNNIEFEYLDNNNGFRQNWFMSNNNINEANLPRAIKVTLTIEKEGQIELLIPIASGEKFTVAKQFW